MNNYSLFDDQFVNKMNASNIFAIVVTYNPNLDLLHNQYSSLNNQIDGIIYVDNGSSNIDEVEAFLRGRSHVYLIKNERNQGLGKAQNQGIEFARSLNANYFIFFDHDSIPNKSFVSNLVYVERQLRDQGILIGAIGPFCVNSDSGDLFAIKTEKRFGNKTVPVSDGKEVIFLLSSGSMISNTTLEKVGLMNEDLFVDYIDSEWSCRAISMGYKLFVVPSSILNHKVGDKRIKFLHLNLAYHSPLRRYYLIRNNLLMFRFRHYPIKMKLTSLFKNILRMLVMLIYSSDRFIYLKYFFYGVWDGILGKKGECRHIKSKNQII
jgi:rhamnosyltransferase